MNRVLQRPGGVLLASGLLGFGVGMLRFPTWQVAVESAQVVAHLVKYPAGNPFYIYHMKLWTILHQICALFLLAGVSEAMLSRIISGVLGMVSFQALSLVVYALSEDAAIAVGASFVIFLSRIADHGVVYPVILLNTDHTYGALGLSLFVLVVALFGAGYSRSSALLLGLAPAVHPSVGAWLWLTIGLTIAWQARLGKRPALDAKFFLSGCAITAVSLCVQLAMNRDAPHVDAAVSARYVHAFVGFWDAHRRPVNLTQVGVRLNAAAVLFAVLWMRWFHQRLPRSAWFILRMVIVTAAISLLCIFASWIPTDDVPVGMLMLMPARLLNFNVMVYTALLFGLLALHREEIWSQVLMLILAAGLLTCGSSMVWESSMWAPATIAASHVDALWILAVVSLGLLAGGAVTQARVASAVDAGGKRVAARMLRGLSIAVLALAAIATLAIPFPPRAFLDRTNDPFFAAAASERRGLLLTGGTFHLVQLYTRRPVLLDAGGLDSLPYAPESGPAMERILRDVYQIDFFRPPPDVNRAASIPHGFNRGVWERFSREKWLSIGRTYDVTQVLTRKDYTLDLPVAAENSYFRLYRIPD